MLKVQASTQVRLISANQSKFSQLPTPVQTFINAQFDSVNKKRMCGGWSPKVVELCLGLEHPSNASYINMQRLGFALPSVTLLRRKRAECMKEVIILMYCMFIT